MSSPYSTSQLYTGSGTLPMPVPAGKGGQLPSFYQGGDNTYSVSPPEVDTSVSSGSAMVPSYSNSGYSATASGYAESSQGDGDSAASANSVDFNEYMQDRFAESFDPLPLDKCMVVQAQTSAHLNAKQRELLELQAKAQARLAKTRQRFAEGLRDAREVRADLEWTQKKVTALNAKASAKHTKEFTKARARYPSPE